MKVEAGEEAGAGVVASAGVVAEAVEAGAGVAAVEAVEEGVAAIAATAAVEEAAIAAGNRTVQFGKQNMGRGVHFAPRLFLATPLHFLVVKSPRRFLQ